jgi:hypothetical protein
MSLNCQIQDLEKRVEFLEECIDKLDNSIERLDEQIAVLANKEDKEITTYCCKMIDAFIEDGRIETFTGLFGKRVFLLLSSGKQYLMNYCPFCGKDF